MEEGNTWKSHSSTQGRSSAGSGTRRHTRCRSWGRDQPREVSRSRWCRARWSPHALPGSAIPAIPSPVSRIRSSMPSEGLGRRPPRVIPPWTTTADGKAGGPPPRRACPGTGDGRVPGDRWRRTGAVQQSRSGRVGREPCLGRRGRCDGSSGSLPPRSAPRVVARMTSMYRRFVCRAHPFINISSIDRPLVRWPVPG
jgi:hypothetical protein